MGKGFFQVPSAYNEPVKSYAPGTPEREEVLQQYRAYYNSQVEVPLYTGGEPVKTGDTKPMSPPLEHQHVVGHYHVAHKKHVETAIANGLESREKWANLSWEQRAAIFLKAAELIAGPYRAKINAATMMAQSKTIHQAEIDAACEFIDFLRFNVEYVPDLCGTTRILRWYLESCGISAPGRLCLRDHPVQLYGNFREPPCQRCHDGKCGLMETQ